MPELSTEEGFFTNSFIVLFLIQSVNRLFLCLGCLWIKRKDIKPMHLVANKDDVETGSDDFPMFSCRCPCATSER
jgi:hypothetical protein